MSLTITLSDQQATVLQAKAEAEGLSSVEAWLEKLAEPEPAVSRPRRAIWEVIGERMKNVPPEDLAAMPKDGASQIDYYVYGILKRAL